MRLIIDNIHKTYGTVKALDGISYKFKPGIYGILGANGAGKSTLINLITDNVKRDSGEEAGGILFVDNLITTGKPVDILDMGAGFRQLVGYMPQQQGFYEDFCPKAFLKYMAHIKGTKRVRGRGGIVKTVDDQIDDLLAIVNLTSVQYQKIGGFSGGMKQRVLLAQALLGNPRILILDEPTAGLDPKERIAIRNYISQLSRNKIILFATHVVSDIECIADQVLLIKKGKLIASGTMEELTKGQSLESVFMEVVNE